MQVLVTLYVTAAALGPRAGVFEIKISARICNSRSHYARSGRHAACRRVFWIKSILRILL